MGARIGYDPTALKRRGAKTLPVIVVTSNSERRKQEDISEVPPSVMTTCGNEFCLEEGTAAREQRWKRKEHDESPKNCCKFTKSTGAKEEMTGPFWMKWMAPSTQEQEEAALEEEKERLERPETKSRKAKDPASKIKQISKKISKLQDEIKAMEEELEAKAGHPLSKA